MELALDLRVLDLLVLAVLLHLKEKVNSPALVVYLSPGNGRGRRSPINLKPPQDVS